MNALRKSIEERLTAQELAVLKLVAEGFENSEIADSLKVVVRTVESHRDHANKKLNVNCAALLTQQALAAGLVKPANTTTNRSLTDREHEVVALIASGKSNKEIATKLGVGVRTIETHRERAMKKFDTHNAAQMTRKALALGIAINQYLM